MRVRNWSGGSNVSHGGARPRNSSLDTLILSNNNDQTNESPIIDDQNDPFNYPQPQQIAWAENQQTSAPSNNNSEATSLKRRFVYVVNYD